MLFSARLLPQEELPFQFSFFPTPGLVQRPKYAESVANLVCDKHCNHCKMKHEEMLHIHLLTVYIIYAQMQVLAHKLRCNEVACFLKDNRHLLFNPNVVSMSYREEIKLGNKTGRKVLQVGVIKKLKRDDVKAPNKLLPKYLYMKVYTPRPMLKSIPVQVVEEGEFQLFAQEVYECGAHLRTRSGDGRNFLGTLGARQAVRIKNRRKHRILTCAHCVIDFNTNSTNGDIEIPFDVAYPMPNVHMYNAQYVNKRWRLRVPRDYVTRNDRGQAVEVLQDVAWAFVNRRRVSCRHAEFGEVSKTQKAEIDMAVKMYGGCSKVLVEGIVRDTDADAWWTQKDLQTHFTNLCYFESDIEIVRRIEKGDSGSAVVTTDNKLVGIFVGRHESAPNLYFSHLPE